MRRLAFSPAASTSPRFVRRVVLCPTCCSDNKLLGDVCAMNCENGIAGMNSPKVPVAVVLYVRLDAMLTDGVIDELEPLPVSGRISSMPAALPPSELNPKKLLSMSSRASVAPGSTSTVVDCPLCVPSVRDDVKLS